MTVSLPFQVSHDAELLCAVDLDDIFRFADMSLDVGNSSPFYLLFS